MFFWKRFASGLNWNEIQGKGGGRQTDARKKNPTYAPDESNREEAIRGGKKDSEGGRREQGGMSWSTFPLSNSVCNQKYVDVEGKDPDKGRGVIGPRAS